MGANEKSGATYIEDRVTKAMHWLEVVSEYDNRILKPDIPYNRDMNRVFRFIGNQIADGNFDTIEMLATLECEAQTHTSTSSWITDTLEQDTARTLQFSRMARLMCTYGTEASI